MTRTLISLLLLCCWLLQAGTTTVVVGQPVGGAAPSYLYSEDFEGSGMPSPWTTILGTPDADYTTSPAPLSGSESLQFSGAERATCYNAWTAVAGTGTTYGYFEMYIAGTTDYNVLDLYDSTPSLIGYFQFRPDGTVRVYQGSNYGYYSAGSIRGALQYVWWDWTPSTGANDGVLNVYFSTTTTKGSIDVTCSNGTSTASPAGFRYYYNGTTDDAIFDDFYVDDVDITTAL